MTRTVKDLINEMAAEIMLHTYGRVPNPENGDGPVDYSESKHPYGRNCFNAACAVWELLKYDSPDLEAEIDEEEE